MINQLLSMLELGEDILWGYICVPVIVLVGLYLTFETRFYQIRIIPSAFKTFLGYFFWSEKRGHGVHPLKAFFASLGGCVGIGNVVAVCTAVQIGGPGALFWIWVTAIIGIIVKYSEVFLGMKYRESNAHGGYSGGPMYYLRQVTQSQWILSLVAVLMCIYGVELYQFSIVTESLSENFGWNRFLVTAVFLALVAFAGSGGVNRVGEISGIIIPMFFFLYVGMAFWILALNIDLIPSVFYEVFSSAFSPPSAVSGVLGGSVMLTISQGVRRGCYTGDIGVGYAATIHSESAVERPEKQASLVVFEIFFDTFVICTLSILLILISGIWKEPLSASVLVQRTLAEYFPFVNFFMPLFLFLLGYSTVNAFFCFGLKSAEYLSEKYGRALFFTYALVSLAFSSIMDTSHAQAVMAISGGLLLIINCWGIFRLRHEVYGFKR